MYTINLIHNLITYLDHKKAYKWRELIFYKITLLNLYFVKFELELQFANLYSFWRFRKWTINTWILERGKKFDLSDTEYWLNNLEEYAYKKKHKRHPDAYLGWTNPITMIIFMFNFRVRKLFISGRKNMSNIELIEDDIKSYNNGDDRYWFVIYVFLVKIIYYSELKNRAVTKSDVDNFKNNLVSLSL